jgi:glycosyltransferase 2 family protein
MNRSLVRTGLRILVTAVTLAWFVLSLDPGSLPGRLGRVRWAVVVPAFCVNVLWLPPSAMRWRGVAKAAGYRIRLADSVRYYTIGSFFNAFLPTGNGGDVVRGVLASRATGAPLGGMLGTVLTERVIGMAVTLAFVAAGGLLLLARSGMPGNVPLSAAALLLALAALAGLTASGRFRALLKTALGFVPWPALRDGARQAGRVLDACRAKPGAVAAAAGWSALNQMAPIAASWLLTFAIPGLDAPFRAFLIAVPLSFVSSLLPSIGGYGVREAGFILFLGWFGVPAGPAAVFGVIRLLFLWTFGLAGAVAFLSGRRGRDRYFIRSAWKRTA